MCVCVCVCVYVSVCVCVCEREREREREGFTISTHNMADRSRGRPEGFFSIANTLNCWGVAKSFSWIPPLTLGKYLIILRIQQGGIKYHF